MALSAGTRLGHYTIIAPLGAGGMGEVWLAEDLTLKRKVALKVLLAAKADDHDRLARLLREAETIAALSHPNIVTLYSIEQDGDVRFLTMELVEGQSLDHLIPVGGMQLAQVLDIGAVVADALGASHERGIVHRDVKPANVMLTKDRRVKVLDFGIAKLREDVSQEAETVSAHQTGEGRLMGTVAYMSPEQAEGKAVDARSDLFSLGIVLFEMATGERPFTGDTGLSVMSAILHDTPKSVTEIRADLPREFGRIVRQCLQKDPEERYQTAKDLRNHLRALKSDLASGEITSAVAPPLTRMSWRRWASIGAAAAVLVALATFAAVRFASTFRVAPSRPFESIQVKQLTDIGKVWISAISPDGRYVVFSVTDGGQESIWLRQVATASDVQIVLPSKRRCVDLSFSHDGNFVYYVMARLGETAGTPGTLYRIASVGGEERRVADDVQKVSVSPDGAHLAFKRYSKARESSLFVATVDGTGERRLTITKDPAYFWSFPWSPDGRSLAMLIGDARTGDKHIVLIDAETGNERDLGAPGHVLSSFGLLWRPDGFLVAGSEKRESEAQIWMISYPGMEARRITHDVNRYHEPGATADGRTIVAGYGNQVVNIWALSQDDVLGARQITFGRTGRDGENGLDWTPDGRVVYASWASGNGDIWSMEADGTKTRQLTLDPASQFRPVVSPDGRFIVFHSTSGGPWELWRMDADGGNPRQLSRAGTSAMLRSFTSDGAGVIYLAHDVGSQNWKKWKVPIDGGDPVPLSAKVGAEGMTAPPGFSPGATSPDGHWIAGAYKAENGASGFAVVSADETRPWRDVKFAPAYASEFSVRWSPDGRTLTYVHEESGVSNLWSQPLNGGPSRQLTSFTSQQIYNFAWSRDGRLLAISRGELKSDLMMITSEAKKN